MQILRDGSWRETYAVGRIFPGGYLIEKLNAVVLIFRCGYWSGKYDSRVDFTRRIVMKYQG
jgi:hypothetical protein